ncbi:MAG: N-acetylmuramoyl-L-alanine amidase [Firmicutes bacterium]|nr:N-acetylmuramoyl-L-alanine amidase [Bacillota bacterium]
MKKLQVILIILCVTVLSMRPFVRAASLPNYGKLLDVVYFCEGGQEGVFVYFDTIKKHSDFTLSNPDRIVVDFEDSLYGGSTKQINTSGSIIYSVKYAQFEKTTVRVVLYVTGKHEYKIEQGEGYLKIYIDKGSSSGGQNLGDNKPGDNQDERRTDERTDERDNIQSSRGNFERGSIDLPEGISIALTARGSSDEVSIALENLKDYNIFTLTKPDRIVVDIPNVKFSKDQSEVSVSGNLVKSIRYAQYQENLGRVVLDLSEKFLFKVNELEGKLILSIEKPEFKSVTYKNITYNNTGDRVFFSISGAKLTEGGEDLKRYYTARYDSTGKVYTITFPSKYAADLSSGVMKLNDHLFESVTIARNLLTGNTSLIFKAREKLTYVVMTRPQVNDTAITVLKPASKSDKLVVIDAGHGGVEPGATYGKLLEKDLNLDIALRLNELLKKRNINTYMVREDDSFVGLYERAFIANSLNAALFLSIHNNAIGDPSFDGTMTLYYVKSSEGAGFNSYNFAKNVQNSMLKVLGTKDRNVKERSDLVVLKATKMPSALAEVGFMTNAGDRQKLQTEEFRQKAAQALCDAIVKSLSEIK